jgi:hypothetical protein
MPPKNKEVPFTPVTDLVNFLGLNYSPPKGAMDNIRHSFGVVPFIRSGIRRVMSLSK